MQHFTKFEQNNVDQRRGENFRNRIFKFYRNAKITQQIPGLATSGRHNSAMITDRP